MEFVPSFRWPLYLSSLFLENSCWSPRTQTMFPSQNSILIPPSPPPMFHPNNTFDHFQDCTVNVPTYNPSFVIEFFQSHHHPFLWDTNPSLGDGSSLGDFINVHHCYPVMLAPNNNALHDCHKDKVIWDFHNKSWFIHLKLLPPNHHHLFLSLVIMDG